MVCIRSFCILGLASLGAASVIARDVSRVSDDVEATPSGPSRGAYCEFCTRLSRFQAGLTQLQAFKIIPFNMEIPAGISLPGSITSSRYPSFCAGTRKSIRLAPISSPAGRSASRSAPPRPFARRCYRNVPDGVLLNASHNSSDNLVC